jgi:hypothetical protein
MGRKNENVFKGNYFVQNLKAVYKNLEVKYFCVGVV